MSELDSSGIRRELRALRDHLTTLGGLAGPLAKDHSRWSAHARWSSTSSKLPSDFSIDTSLGLPHTAEQLDRLIHESGSDKLLAVAKELADICGTPPKPKPMPKT